MKPVRLSREAVDELEDAAVWYEQRREGLGARFLLAANEIQQQISHRPHSFPRLLDTRHPDIRRALLRGFPYAMVFMDLRSEIRVLAVAHAKRDPGYWLNRVR